VTVLKFDSRWHLFFVCLTVNDSNLQFQLIFFLWPCDPTRVMASSFVRFLDHTQRRITVGKKDFSGRVISSSQRPVPHNTQHSQQTNIHALGGIRTHDLSRRAAADLRLRPRSYWDRRHGLYSKLIHCSFVCRSVGCLVFRSFLLSFDIKSQFLIHRKRKPFPQYNPIIYSSSRKYRCENHTKHTITRNIQTHRVGKMQSCFILHHLVCSSNSNGSKILVAERGGRTPSAPASR
jgi:hypothetical protein